MLVGSRAKFNLYWYYAQFDLVCFKLKLKFLRLWSRLIWLGQDWISVWPKLGLFSLVKPKSICFVIISLQPKVILWISHCGHLGHFEHIGHFGPFWNLLHFESHWTLWTLLVTLDILGYKSRVV